MMKIKVFIATVFLAIFAFSAQAQSTATPQVTKRQVKQQKRINKGVKSGELTRRETVSLQRQQKRIRGNKISAKSDGKVTTLERSRIHAQQNRASRNVARKKHNNRSRRP